MAGERRAVRTSRDLAIIFCLFLVAACGSPATPSPSAPLTSTGASTSVGPAGSATVVMGLYSGRPDPQWALTGEEAAALDTALVALPKSTSTPPVGGLGYHGFTIVLSDRTLVAYRGAVAPPGDGLRTVMADPTRSIERYLLETSRRHVTADDYRAVEQALAAP
jgi:hypothetical protein